jgi:hypothetical protein
VFRWLLAIVLGGFGWMVILANFGCVYVWLVRREHRSWIPFIGGVFALGGMAFCPVTEIRRFAFWPLYIDTCYFILAITVGLLMELYAWRARRKKHDA